MTSELLFAVRDGNRYLRRLISLARSAAPDYGRPSWDKPPLGAYSLGELTTFPAEDVARIPVTCMER